MRRGDAGFARFARASLCVTNNHFPGFARLRSRIPARLRRGNAKQKKGNGHSSKLDVRFFFRFAESEGFEPPVRLPVHRISSAALSTTQATFLKAVQIYE